MSSDLRSIFSRPEAVVLEEDFPSGRPIYPLPVALELASRLRRLAAQQLGLHGRMDALLALGFAVAGEVEAVVKAGGRRDQLAIAVLAGPSLGVPIAFRRSRPLLAILVLTVIAAGGTVLQVFLPPGNPGSADVFAPIFALLLLTYSLGAHGRGRELALGVIASLLLIVTVDLLQPGSRSLVGALAFFAVFIVGGPVLAGRLVRVRQTLVGRLAEQERQIDAERVAQSEAALRLERLQLAERLHETLVAGMESLVTQVAVAQHSLGHRQAEAVAGIEATARSLLADTRKVVVSLSSNPGGDRTSRGDPLGAVGSPPQPMEAPRTAALPWLALAAAAVCIGLLIEIRATHNVRVPMAVVLIGCFAIAAPLTLAWRRPLLTTAALYAAATVFSAFVFPLGALFTAIALSFLPPFTVAFYENRGRAVAGFAVCSLGELACFGIESLPANVAFLISAWCAGRVLRARSRMVDEMERNNAMLAEQREAGSRRIVLEERARVARELHDAIGHSLTVVALQAGAARRRWTSDREGAQAAIRTIAGVAAEGLAELRMGFTSRQFTEPHGPARIARQEDIEPLLEGARGTGVAVRLHIEGDEPTLSADTELAAYRVLQEALTNLLRHAPGAAADVTVRSGDSCIELVVSNGASDQPSLYSADRTHGLRGMQERVEACGGRLNWGRRADGGFEVRAEFPAEFVKA